MFYPLTVFSMGSIETSDSMTKKLVRVLKTVKYHSAQDTFQCDGTVPSITERCNPQA
jgi:hypothetical protein